MLSFAGFEDFEIETADVPQQFAEKIHAFTRPRQDRDNTRVKDLAEVVLFITQGLDPDAARAATIHGDTPEVLGRGPPSGQMGRCEPYGSTLRGLSRLRGTVVVQAVDRLSFGC